MDEKEFAKKIVTTLDSSKIDDKVAARLAKARMAALEAHSARQKEVFVQNNGTMLSSLKEHLDSFGVYLITLLMILFMLMINVNNPTHDGDLISSFKDVIEQNDEIDDSDFKMLIQRLDDKFDELLDNTDD